MKIYNLIRFTRRIQRINMASGKKRLIYVFVNLLLMILGVASVFGVKWSLDMMSSQNVLVGLVCFIFTVSAAIILCLQGFVAQIASCIISGIGMFKSEERKINIAIFIISLLTTIGLIVTCIFLLV